MSSDVNLSRIHREMARWRIMVALNASRPVAASVHLLWQIVADLKLPLTVKDVRAELDYLEGKHLVSIDGRDTARDWEAELTATGIDVVEYTVPAPAGILRPPLPGQV